jgi:hypothetical protein
MLYKTCQQFIYKSYKKGTKNFNLLVGFVDHSRSSKKLAANEQGFVQAGHC